MLHSVVGLIAIQVNMIVLQLHGPHAHLMTLLVAIAHSHRRYVYMDMYIYGAVATGGQGFGTGRPSLWIDTDPQNQSALGSWQWQQRAA